MSDFGPSLEQILEWTRTGAIGPDAQLSTPEQAELDAKAELVARVFRTNDGRAVLELLADATVRRAPVDHRLGVGADYVAYAQLRQGQNQVFGLIATYLNHHDEQERNRVDQSKRPALHLDAAAFGAAGEPAAGVDPARGEFDPGGSIGIG